MSAPSLLHIGCTVLFVEACIMVTTFLVFGIYFLFIAWKIVIPRDSCGTCLVGWAIPLATASVAYTSDNCQCCAPCFRFYFLNCDTHTHEHTRNFVFRHKHSCLGEIRETHYYYYESLSWPSLPQTAILLSLFLGEDDAWRVPKYRGTRVN